MKIYLVSSVAHQGTGYEHGLEKGGARELLVSFLDSTGKRDSIWPRLQKRSRNPSIDQPQESPNDDES